VVHFELPRALRAGVRIFTADGRLVRILAPVETLEAGNHTLRWDGRDEHGRGAASGVYVVRLDAGGESRSQRAVLVR
jgi:flagellar hook assembly protein FlgD